LCLLLARQFWLRRSRLALSSTIRRQERSRLKSSYEPRNIAPIRLANCSLDLLRAGKLFVAARRDCFGVENNSTRVARYGPEISRSLDAPKRAACCTAYRRRSAGPASAAAQATGSRRAASAALASLSVSERRAVPPTPGMVITATGTAFQNLDPVLSLGQRCHQTRPQANTITTALTATVFDFLQQLSIQKAG
jgi:hypothetical protein